VKLVERFRNRWDRVRGLDFVSVVEPEAVGLEARTAFRSSPSGNRFLEAVLKDLVISGADSILDVGCGKGSAMRIMRRFPFAHVDGIELSREIAAIAAQNFERLGARDISVVTGDARLYDGYARYNIAYFYNPFPAEVMAPVLDRMRAAWRAPARERLIIYNNPVCHGLLLDRGFLALRDYPDEWGNGIRLYSSVPAEASRIRLPARGR
jgi:SAM-dependent methyltransferase